MSGWNKDNSWPGDMLLLIKFNFCLKEILGALDLRAGRSSPAVSNCVALAEGEEACFLLHLHLTTCLPGLMLT